MLRRCLGTLVLAPILACAWATPASALIVPQKSIAGIKMHMSQSRVLEKLGDPTTTITRQANDDFFTTYTYRGRGLKVVFHPNSANTKNVVVSVKVYRGRKQLTANGIGIASRRAAVKRKIDNVKCRRFDPTYAQCWVGSGRYGTRITSFFLDRRNRVEEVSFGIVLGD